MLDTLYILIIINLIETIAYDKNNKSREENDFYATPSDEVRNILSKEKIYGTILENSCGQGHIGKVVEELYQQREWAKEQIERRAGDE